MSFRNYPQKKYLDYFNGDFALVHRQLRDQQFRDA